MLTNLERNIMIQIKRVVTTNADLIQRLSYVDDDIEDWKLWHPGLHLPLTAYNTLPQCPSQKIKYLIPC